MRYLLAGLLSLIAAGPIAWIVALFAADGRPDSRDDDPVPLPPARPAAELLVGAHAAPMGRARVADPALVLDTPEHVSRHAAPEPTSTPWFTPSNDGASR